MSKKLYIMYAKELFIAGEDKDFLEAKAYYEESVKYENRSMDEMRAAQCVLVKAARLERDTDTILKNSLKNFASETASAEVCYEIGEYFFEKNDYDESIIWFYNAAFETQSELNIHYSGDYPLERLAKCYEMLGNTSEKEKYLQLAKKWELPKSADVR